MCDFPNEEDRNLHCTYTQIYKFFTHACKHRKLPPSFDLDDLMELKKNCKKNGFHGVFSERGVSVYVNEERFWKAAANERTLSNHIKDKKEWPFLPNS